MLLVTRMVGPALTPLAMTTKSDTLVSSIGLSRMSTLPVRTSPRASMHVPRTSAYAPHLTSGLLACLMRQSGGDALYRYVGRDWLALLEQHSTQSSPSSSLPHATSVAECISNCTKTPACDACSSAAVQRLFTVNGDLLLSVHQRYLFECK